ARRIAHRLALPYARQRLLEDPSYNLRLGTQHLADLLVRFEGSAVLALAAYNAGANTVERWLQTYGDPRAPGSDPVDWIELIPYGETRNYVQRVLEAAPIYSERLGYRAPRTLGAWLALGRRPPAPGVTERRQVPATES
ncbi:MAG: lytic transglycosylase domain-containing protein, partial [Alphaproteobacteria bacterium]